MPSEHLGETHDVLAVAATRPAQVAVEHHRHGAHRIDFEITQVPKGGGTEWQRSERSTFVVPR